MQFSFVILALVAISTNCVNAKSPSKIVGGKPVNIPDIPSIVLIRHVQSFNSTHAAICGGTIISPWHILTAAHCFRTNATDPEDLRHPRWYQIIAGKNSYRPNAKTYEIEEVYSHPNFTEHMTNDDTRRADIAVIKLKEKIRINRVHRPIEMASEELGNFAKGHIYGWGATNPRAIAVSSYLQGLLVIVINRETCAEYYPLEQLTKDEFCVVNPRGGSLCDGDSGGPVIINGKLAGVMSTGPSNCNHDMPGYIISVAHHKSWIEDVINGAAQARKYFAKNVAGSTHSVQSSQSSQNREESNRRDELSLWQLLQ